ncbi:MAG: nitronate monooxygenase [Pseudomonadota bacterium]
MEAKLNDWHRQLDLKHPIVAAPMAGVSTPPLADAVTSAGALGALAVGAQSATAVEGALRETSALASAAVMANFFCHPRPRDDADEEQRWLAALQDAFEQQGASAPSEVTTPYESFDERPELIDLILDYRVRVASFHFGLPKARTLARLKRAGVCLFATATCASEARVLAAAGIDVIVAQGWEAGGHRGNFTSAPDEQLGTLSLLRRLRGAVDLPIIAAGGIVDGAGVAAAFAAGAQGVQCGTAFVPTPESAAAPAYRAALAAGEQDTVMTAGFSGRAARGLRNRFVESFATLPPIDYPRAYGVVKSLVAAAEARGDHGLTPMWAGQSYPDARAASTAEIVDRLADGLPN